MAAFFHNHGRFKEAEALEREQLAPDNPSSTAFLASAVYTLANLEIDAGRSDDAKMLLESALTRAEVQHGQNSSEYGQLLSDLFENRRYARDYETAEDIARRLLRRTEEDGASDPNERSAALSRLAEICETRGKIKEAGLLRKRGIELSNEGLPRLAILHARQFEEAGASVQKGKPEEAVRIAAEIADSPPHGDDGDQFRFRQLAEAMMTTGQKKQAEKVASLALSSEERNLGDDPRLARDLADWAYFYGELEKHGESDQPDRALNLLTRAEVLVKAYGGVASRRMEPVLQGRAWLAAKTGGQTAGIPYLEQLRDLRVSIYGENSRQVEQTTTALAVAHARADDWPGAAKLYFKTIDISTRRTAAFGNEYVGLLDSIASEFLNHGDTKTALELNQRAIDHAHDFVDADRLKQVLLEHREEMRPRNSEATGTPRF